MRTSKIVSQILIVLILVASLPVQFAQANSFQITDYNIDYAEALKRQIQASDPPQTDKRYDAFISADALIVNNTTNPTSATVRGTSSWNVRGGPGTNFWILGQISGGTQINILGSAMSSNNQLWYRIQYNRMWVNASPTDVEAYFNPNNFRPGTNSFFQFLKLSSPAGITAQELNNNILFDKGSLQGMGQAFVEAANRYNINEIYLISHALLETANGRSYLANGSAIVNGVPVYNMFGIGAFDDCPYTCGEQYAFQQGWFTPEAAIIGGAQWIADRFIYRRNLDTLYKMRWNPANPATNQYATDIGWAVKQTTRMSLLYGSLSTFNLQYDIPRYRNQPGTAPDYSTIERLTQAEGSIGYTTGRVNFRSAPRVGNDTFISVVEANTRVEVIEKNLNNWYKINFNGQIGWISGDFLRIEINNISRIAGVNLWETSAKISQQGWSQSDTVILARGDLYQDALAGVPLAKKENAPLLLSRNNRLDDFTRNELQRLRTKRVIILGGELAVHPRVEQEIKQLGIRVERIAGRNSHDTAALIADRVAPNGSTKAIVVTDNRFHDALSVASFAGIEGIPILLTRPDSLPAATRNAINKLGVNETLVIGGHLAISNKVANSLPSPIRLAGANAFDTNAAIFNHFQSTSSMVYIATSGHFGDGLSGAALAARESTGVILVGNGVSNRTRTQLEASNYHDIKVLGGPLAVNQNTFEQLKTIMK